MHSHTFGQCGTVGWSGSEQILVVHASVLSCQQLSSNVVPVDVVCAQKMQGRALDGDGRRAVWKMEGECGVVDGCVVMGREI